MVVLYWVMWLNVVMDKVKCLLVDNWFLWVFSLVSSLVYCDGLVVIVMCVKFLVVECSIVGLLMLMFFIVLLSV